MGQVLIIEERDEISFGCKALVLQLKSKGMKIIREKPRAWIEKTDQIEDVGAIFALVPTALDTELIKKRIREVEQATEIILFFNRTEQQSEQMKVFGQFSKQDSRIKGLIDLGQPEELYWPLYNRILACFEKDSGANVISIQQLNSQLKNAIDTVSGEVDRVKRLHGKLVPLRENQVKGVNIVSKYSPGQSSGGEYFDFFEKGPYVSILLSSCQSYVVSSVVLGHFTEERFAQEDWESEFMLACKELCTSLEDMGIAEELERLELVFLRVNLNTKELEGYLFGRHLIVGDRISYVGNEVRLNSPEKSNSKIQLRLDRGERVLIASSGYRRNCHGQIMDTGLEKYMESQLTKSLNDGINDLFFQIKKEKPEEFLEFDATIIGIEVQENAFIQV